MLTPVFIGLFLLITLASIFVRAPDVGAQFLIAVLIGGWSSRQLLVPGNLEGVTAIDVFLVAMYFVAGVIFLGQFARALFSSGRGTPTRPTKVLPVTVRAPGPAEHIRPSRRKYMSRLTVISVLCFAMALLVVRNRPRDD